MIIKYKEKIMNDYKIQKEDSGDSLSFSVLYTIQYINFHYLF